MKKLAYLITLYSFFSNAQTPPAKEPGHYSNNKFEQIDDLLATPNLFRTASGAPGPAYYQQQADYKIDIELDDKQETIYGTETITYTNNSPDELSYLWVQLDQNKKAKDSKSPLVENQKIENIIPVENFTRKYLENKTDYGFQLEYVRDLKGKDLPKTINQTMMVVDLPQPLRKGEKFVFQIKWKYKVNDYMADRDRSGFEKFKDGNNLYVIAQFYPRMAVYNDVKGWQNMQFWGSGEFALPFGNFEVNITVPADHIMEATGELTNRSEVFSKAQQERYAAAEKSFDKPVVVVTQEEAMAAEKGFSNQKKTWKFKATNVRDFGFSTSRKFMYDAMAVKLANKTVMAISLYPKESNPLWETYSTRAVAQTLKTYSKHTFDYPYPKAVSVSAEDQGMEYPMICWNYGRPDKDGFVSDRIKYGMISVIIHEVGHNFFPMIVNSDERQWSWMDEGLNTFLQYLTEQEFQPNYPSSRGPAAKIVPYMSGDQNFLEPIMSNSENIANFGSNAYSKPATGLNILRETIMGKALFDRAFKTYATRWMFKHPTPDDFFRTMEDASAVDLDWFWRGWFYSTDFVDIGIQNVNQYYVSTTPTSTTKDIKIQKGRNGVHTGPVLYLLSENNPELKATDKKIFETKNFSSLEAYMDSNFTTEEKSKIIAPKYFYEVEFNKPGGMIMPILVDLYFEDGTTESHTFPAQIWRKNNHTVKRVFATQKSLTKIVLDPKAETADIDTSNNTWPKSAEPNKFDTSQKN